MRWLCVRPVDVSRETNWPAKPLRCTMTEGAPTGLTGAARAVIADDERLMREQLRSRLAEAWPELNVVGEAKNGVEAVRLVDELRPDVVFLDIRMPGLTGVEAARQIAQLPARRDEMAGDDPDDLPEIVFLTAYDEYAVQAFEQGVADYVLKPAERDRLNITVRRVQSRLKAKQGVDDGDGLPPRRPLQMLLNDLTKHLHPGQSAKYLRWVQAMVGNTIQIIPAQDIIFFISDEKYTRVQTAVVESLIRKPIKELVDELDPSIFWQIHRSTMVNVNFISSIQRDLRGRQVVSVRGHPERLEVSRSFIGLFKGM